MLGVLSPDRPPGITQKPVAISANSISCVCHVGSYKIGGGSMAPKKQLTSRAIRGRKSTLNRLMGYGYDIPRKDVRLDGIPLIWNTNLQDDAITQLYQRILEIGSITRLSSVDVAGFMSISLNIYDEFVPFREGACHCLGVNDTIYAIYKTSFEWEVWAARQDEVKELREEQEIDAAVERQLAWAEECYLISQCTAAGDRGDDESAYGYLCARAELLKQHSSCRFSMFMFDEVFMRLASFPTEHCIRFLTRYELPWDAYMKLAASKAFWMKAESAEYRRIFDAAIQAFPSEGMLFKGICLFWRRRKELATARHYCQIAVDSKLSDDTRSGFVGRLRRLAKENLTVRGG
ncbi:MAG: hypothetical protein WAO00_14500 [Chthoniobacterales bacterium]